MLLCKFGFEYVWNAQGVQDENALLCVFEDRAKQHFVTLWRNKVLNSRKLSTYSMLKTEFYSRTVSWYFKNEEAQRNILQVKMF